MPTISFEDFEEKRRELPAVWTICHACEGEGKSSAYLGAYTSEDMDEAGPDFHDEYMSGTYDRACDACDGTGKVLRLDRKTAKRTHPKILKLYDQVRRVDRELEAEERAERRFMYGLERGY